MNEISQTESLCSQCLKVVPARIVETDDRVFMEKECPRHGLPKTLISSDAGWYHRMMTFSPHVRKPVHEKTASDRGCPYNCGYCPSHRQRMYLPIVPITSVCNLNCPVCYTINKNTNPYFMTRNEFADILEHIRRCDPEMRIINLTGGEPLLHPQFREMVKMCRDAGIRRITVSTNGLRFLEDESLLPELTVLGARIVLSFNSFDPEPYRIFAGADLLEKKLRILKLLEICKPSATLLTVVAAGVNDHEIGDIVRFVLESDFVISSEIHTVTFTGQSIGRFDRAARLTTPDVIADIAKKNPGIAMNDFLPSPCAHPLCYAICYLLNPGGTDAIPFTKFASEKDVIRMMSDNLYIEPTLDTEEVLTDVMNDLWSREHRTEKDERILSSLKELIRRMFPPGGIDTEARQKIAENSTKAICIHSHTDAENFDTERMKYCCAAVPDGKGGNIPTCAYNTIYRAKDPRFAAMSQGTR